MPFYRYQCEDCGEEIEAFQKMSDEPLTICPACGDILRNWLIMWELFLKAGATTVPTRRSHQLLKVVANLQLLPASLNS